MSHITNPSPRIMAFDDTDSTHDALDLLFIEHFVAGSHPYAHVVDLARVRGEATLLPPGVDPVRMVVEGKQRTLIATGPGWVLLAHRWPGGNARVCTDACSARFTPVGESNHPITPAAM